eukprot:SM000021S06478  [mRNA]  locus=s21:576738:580034:- [translate_table: standard]
MARWQEPIPMAQVEGSPGVFSVVCNLAPGYHQFKFIVDQEWRHDESQSFMPDPLSNVNNWLLVKEPVPAPLLPSPPDVASAGHPHGGGPHEAHGGSMDLDPMDVSHHSQPHPTGTPGHEDYQARSERAPSLSSCSLTNPYASMSGHQQGQQQLMPEVISAADAEASKQRIADYLNRHTAYELLPESGKVVALDVNLPVKQAFHALYEQGVPAAPLWDSQQQDFVGMLSASDFIAILRQLRSNGQSLSEEELETHTIAAWKEEKLAISRQDDAPHTPSRRPLVSVTPDDSLRHVAMALLQAAVATVPVLHRSSADGGAPQLLHLASLSGILKCVARHFRHVAGSLPLLAQPLGALPVGSWATDTGRPGRRPLTTLRASAPLSTALTLLLQGKYFLLQKPQIGVSSLPVVDENGALTDVYARSDITALARDRTYARLQLEDITVAQALHIRQDAVGGATGQLGTRCHMCLRSDTLRSIIDHLATPGVRRLICVEAGSRRVEGIVSLTDIFNFLLA